MEKRGPVTHVGHEHRGWHGDTWADTEPDGELLLVLAVTVMLVVSVLEWLDALVFHVL